MAIFLPTILRVSICEGSDARGIRCPYLPKERFWAQTLGFVQFNKCAQNVTSSAKKLPSNSQNLTDEKDTTVFYPIEKEGQFQLKAGKVQAKQIKQLIQTHTQKDVSSDARPIYCLKRKFPHTASFLVFQKNGQERKIGELG